MIKLIVKLAIVALVANATFQLGSAYMSFYRFKDSVQEAAQFGGRKSEAELQQRVLDLASQYSIPIDEADFTVRRQEPHTYINGSYKKTVQLFPGYPYDWPFTFNVDVFTVVP